MPKFENTNDDLLMRSDTRLTTRGLTQGMSETQPMATLPKVFVMPIIEMRKEACSGASPALAPICNIREHYNLSPAACPGPVPTAGM